VVNKKLVFILVSFVLIASATLSQAQWKTSYTIQELNQQGFSFGTYEVVGYVTKIYTCPSCPEPGVCVPCTPDYIVLSEQNSLLAKYEVTEKELIVFAENAEQFKLNKKYKLLIQILDVKSTEQMLNNIKLIYSEEI